MGLSQLLRVGSLWILLWGFTPLGGVMMGTRTEILTLLSSLISCNIQRISIPQKMIAAFSIVNQGSWGVSGQSSDMRDVIAAMEAGEPWSTLAYEMYIDRIQKHIGQYLAVLNGADAIIFTAGIGVTANFRENEDVISGISWFGCDVWIQKERLWCNGRHLNGRKRKSVSWLFNRWRISDCTRCWALEKYK